MQIIADLKNEKKELNEKVPVINQFLKVYNEIHDWSTRVVNMRQ